MAVEEADYYRSRGRIDRSVHSALGERRTPLRVYSEPAGDPGWFGPDSITWQVHAQLGPMLIGGLSALFLQSLHPLVVQGVADHSNYREDPFGRLQRTADFIASTTYGSNAMATAAVRQVRQIHGHIRGQTASGRRYRATDPALLTYVHVTEVWSFLRSHQRYSQHPLLLEEKNRYLAEMALVAEKLGGRSVPRSTEEVRRYLRDLSPELENGSECQQVVGFLLKRHRPTAFERVAQATLTEAAIDLLPRFAREMLGFYRLPGYRSLVVRPAAAALSLTLHRRIGDAPML
ncbi:MAG TPA: oxygenase MpaB family protein, partial [Acidimicrobiales bacterium]|nr:oxygenase MpaB family protein [Acidimicrobiales bacterium]